MLGRLGVSVAIAAALVALAAVPAVARSHHRLAVSSITLDADAAVVDAGHSVGLSGSIVPPAGGVPVDILDDADAYLASTTTGGDGSFTLHVVPSANVTLHASSGGADSAPVTVGVRAVVTSHLGAVRLFDTATATGSVTPVRAGSDVDLTLLRRGATVAKRTATVGAAGGYRAGFHIHRIGRYRVRASFSAPDLVTGQASSGPRVTRLPRLRKGSRSRYVLLLERRLRELHYHLTSVDRHFDFRTADAVLAFRKVQRMRRISTVTASTWRALASPRRFGVRGPRRGFHIEVNKSLQVLATVRGGRVTAMIHVSTGAPATPTPEGTFRVNRKIAGYSPHRLYYPSYFDGNRAIHGWPDVPPYNASHGCVRVPYWTARWIFHLAKLGTKVLIYH